MEEERHDAVGEQQQCGGDREREQQLILERRAQRLLDVGALAAAQPRERRERRDAERGGEEAERLRQEVGHVEARHLCRAGPQLEREHAHAAVEHDEQQRDADRPALGHEPPDAGSRRREPRREAEPRQQRQAGERAQQERRGRHADQRLERDAELERQRQAGEPCELAHEQEGGLEIQALARPKRPHGGVLPEVEHAGRGDEQDEQRVRGREREP